MSLLLGDWGRGVGPWHQRIDVLVEMTIGKPGEEITQVS